MKRAHILLATLLVACAPIDSKTRRHTQGQPVEYQNGFRDGCASGYVAAGHPYSKFSKDIDAFANVEHYKQGWNDGFQVCKSDYESIGRYR